MEELLQNANLGSTERALIIIAGIIVIVLVLVIMYMIDNLPDNYKMKKKHNIKSKDNEDNEDEEVEDNEELEELDQMDEHAAEEQMEELFNKRQEMLNSKTNIQAIDFGNDNKKDTNMSEPEETNQENDQLPEKEESLNFAEEEQPVVDIFSSNNEEPVNVTEEEIEEKTEPEKKDDDLDINIFEDNSFSDPEPEKEKEPETVAEVVTEEPKAESSEYSMFTDDMFTSDASEEPVEEKKKSAPKKTTTEKTTTTKKTTKK